MDLKERGWSSFYWPVPLVLHLCSPIRVRGEKRQLRKFSLLTAVLMHRLGRYYEIDGFAPHKRACRRAGIPSALAQELNAATAFEVAQAHDLVTHDVMELRKRTMELFQRAPCRRELDLWPTSVDRTRLYKMAVSHERHLERVGREYERSQKCLQIGDSKA